MDIQSVTEGLIGVDDFDIGVDDNNQDMVDTDVLPFTTLPSKTRRQNDRTMCKLCRLPAKTLPNLRPGLKKFYEFEQALLQGSEDKTFHSLIQQYYNKNLIRADKETPRNKRLNLIPISLEEVTKHYEETEHLNDHAILVYNKQIREMLDICNHFSRNLLWRMSPMGQPIPDIPNQKAHQEYLKILQTLMNNRDRLLLANSAKARPSAQAQPQP